MQRDVLQAACRPASPDAPRTARISFQTQAPTFTCRTMYATGRNRTTHDVADRSDGLSRAQRVLRIRPSPRGFGCPASVHPQACAARDRASFSSVFAPHAQPVQSRFDTRTPSRECDVRRLLHPVFDRASQHPAARRAMRAIPTHPATLAERARAA